MRAILSPLILFLCLPSAVFGAVITSSQSGNWSSTTTWVGGRVPGDGDEVVILDTHAVKIDQDIGSSAGGLLTLHVGTKDGSGARLEYDGGVSGRGYQLTFADGPGVYGVEFWGAVDLEGTPDHPLTVTVRSQNGAAYTFIRKHPNSSHVNVTLKQVNLRSVGNELQPAIDARDAKRSTDRVIFSENQLDHSGALQLAGADGGAASILVSGNTALNHKGSFVQFQGAQHLTIDHNQVTLSYFPSGAPGQALIESIKGDGVGSEITIENNTLISQINADTADGCAQAPPQRYGIWIEGFSNVIVRGNRILAQGAPEGCANTAGFFGFDEGIHLAGAGADTSNVSLDANVISNTIHGIGIATAAGSTGLQVTRNVIFDNRNEHIFVATGVQIYIANNILYGFLHSGQAGILLYSTDQVQIVNNTLEGLQPDGQVTEHVVGIAIGNKTTGATYTSTHVTILNNILTHWGKAIQNRDSDNGYQEVGYSLFFGNLKNYEDLAVAPAAQFPVSPPGDVSQDPLYMSAGFHDYHIQAGSPAVDRAFSALAPPIDLDGDPRPNGAGFDIGADEVSSASADLIIGIVDSPDPVTVNAQLTYTVTLTNSGSSVASDVTISDTLPPGARFVSIDISQGSCAGTSQTVCRLGNLPSKGSANLTLTVTPTVAGVINNKVEAASASPSMRGDANAQTTVVDSQPTPGGADLALGITHSPNPGAVGNSLTYTITLVNSGTETASDVVLSDALPKEATMVSSSASQGSCAGGAPLTCNLGTIGSGGKAEIVIVATPNSAGVLTDTATVSSSTADLNLSNNNAAESVTVNPSSGIDPPASSGKGKGGGGCSVDGRNSADDSIVTLLGVVALWAGKRRLKRGHRRRRPEISREV